ncbi:hypothetical protein L4D77_22215 [Photobacterium frigidiphilum]|uniref:DUF6625 family protein n=1 Tax=Photobacterium frigidiphilum TaxID=264736 RepID=UPI003D123097
MKKVLFIVPYYGKFPPYFSQWLQSCANNPNYNWLIVSDQDNLYVEAMLPSNVEYLNISLLELKKKVEVILGFDFEYFNPYRLCDCRPIYGLLFEKEVSPYDFWGWCDVDLIFGNLEKFITPERMRNHDRIYNKGHLSLIRNNSAIRCMLEKMLTEKKVIDIFKSKHPQGFDERLFNAICISSGLRFLTDKECIDISPRFYEFLDVNTNARVKARYEYGSVLDQFDKEYVYIHFQKRKFRNNKISSQKFNMSENGFTSCEVVEKRFIVIIKNILMYLTFIKKHLFPQYINRVKSIIWNH